MGEPKDVHLWGHMKGEMTTMIGAHQMKRVYQMMIIMIRSVVVDADIYDKKDVKSG